MKHMLKFILLVMALAVMLSAPMASFARGGNPNVNILATYAMLRGGSFLRTAT